MSAAKFSNRLRPLLYSSALLLAAFLTAQSAIAQVSTTGSVTSIGASPAGATQNVNTLSTVGFAAPGTATVTGAGTVLNIFDGVNPDASLRVGSDLGDGRFFDSGSFRTRQPSRSRRPRDKRFRLV